MIAEPRMWPASTNVAWSPGATSISVAVVDGLELSERQLGVLGGVERLVEVDLEVRRLGAQLAPRGRAARRVGSGGFDGRRDVLRHRPRAVRPSASLVAIGDLAGRRQLDGRLVLVRLAPVVGGDLVRVALLPACLALGELLVELARVEQDQRRPARPCPRSRGSGRRSPP